MIAVAVTAAASLALPAAAGAATKVVNMGTPPSAGKAFQNKGADVNDFFPHGVTIHVGDSLKFVPVGFHTADFPARGSKPLALVAPGSPIAGVTDAAGAPFWFNGQASLNFNPALFAGLYGKKATYNGSKTVNTGLPLAARPKPATIKFTKKGSFTYYCNVHPGMKGVVKVKARKAAIPGAKSDKKTVAKQIARDLKVAKALAKKAAASATPGSVNVGLGGKGGVEFFGMVPRTLTVAPGTTVNFHMSKLSVDVHTATFGPGNPETAPTSYLGQIAASFQGASLDQRGVYPSEVPGSPAAVVNSKTHGNGFWNTGVMDTSNATPLPSNGSATFDTPGTYDYYCVIHPFMHGQIVVK